MMFEVFFVSLLFITTAGEKGISRGEPGSIGPDKVAINGVILDATEHWRTRHDINVLTSCKNGTYDACCMYHPIQSGLAEMSSAEGGCDRRCCEKHRWRMQDLYDTLSCDDVGNGLWRRWRRDLIFGTDLWKSGVERLITAPSFYRCALGSITSLTSFMVYRSHLLTNHMSPMKIYPPTNWIVRSMETHFGFILDHLGGLPPPEKRSQHTHDGQINFSWDIDEEQKLGLWETLHTPWPIWSNLAWAHSTCLDGDLANVGFVPKALKHYDDGKTQNEISVALSTRSRIGTDILGRYIFHHWAVDAMVCKEDPVVLPEGFNYNSIQEQEEGDGAEETIHYDPATFEDFRKLRDDLLLKREKRFRLATIFAAQVYSIIMFDYPIAASVDSDHGENVLKDAHRLTDLAEKCIGRGFVPWESRVRQLIEASFLFVAILGVVEVGVGAKVRTKIHTIPASDSLSNIVRNTKRIMCTEPFWMRLVNYLPLDLRVGIDWDYTTPNKGILAQSCTGRNCAGVFATDTSMVSPRFLLVDIGTHTGDCALYALHKFSTLDIIAFEPMRHAYNAFRRTVLDHGLESSVKVENMVVADQGSGTIDLLFPATRTAETLMAKDNECDDSTLDCVRGIKATTLDTYFASIVNLRKAQQHNKTGDQRTPITSLPFGHYTKIDILKVHCQHCEPALVRGSWELLTNNGVCVLLIRPQMMVPTETYYSAPWFYLEKDRQFDSIQEEIERRYAEETGKDLGEMDDELKARLEKRRIPFYKQADRQFVRAVKTIVQRTVRPTLVSLFQTGYELNVVDDPLFLKDPMRLWDFDTSVQKIRRVVKLKMTEEDRHIVEKIERNSTGRESNKIFNDDNAMSNGNNIKDFLTERALNSKSFSASDYLQEDVVEDNEQIIPDYPTGSSDWIEMRMVRYLRRRKARYDHNDESVRTDAAEGALVALDQANPDCEVWRRQINKVFKTQIDETQTADPVEAEIL